MVYGYKTIVLNGESLEMMLCHRHTKETEMLHDPVYFMLHLVGFFIYNTAKTQPSRYTGGTTVYMIIVQP